MKKTHLAVIALGAILLTGYTGCGNTSQGVKQDLSNAKSKIQAGKQAAKNKAEAAKKRLAAAKDDVYEDLAE
jgi:predicted small secreted protein